MKLELLPSVVGASSVVQFLSSYRINDRIAIDAGSLGLLEDLSEQEAVRDVLLTHAHIDHIASLGPFIDNTNRLYPESPATIHCSQSIADALERHYFNDVVWPNLLRLPSPDQPYARLAIHQPEAPFVIEDLTIWPVPVAHSVPALGYLVRDEQSTVVFSGDTGPTERLWELARSLGNVRAVILEVAFPDEMQPQAKIAGHLTPRDFRREVAKLGTLDGVTLFAVHLKARHQQLIWDQLDALRLPNLQRLVPGHAYKL